MVWALSDVWSKAQGSCLVTPQLLVYNLTGAEPDLPCIVSKPKVQVLRRQSILHSFFNNNRCSYWFFIEKSWPELIGKILLLGMDPMQRLQRYHWSFLSCHRSKVQSLQILQHPHHCSPDAALMDYYFVQSSTDLFISNSMH